MSLHVSSTCAHHLEVKIALHGFWYHQTYRCDDTRGCVMQFWPHDDEHMCSKHVETWNKLIVKQKFCASSWLITEIDKSSLLGAHSSLQWPFIPTVTLFFPTIDQSCELCLQKAWSQNDFICWKLTVSVLNGLLSVHLLSKSRAVCALCTAQHS